jgi:enoyl-CoA hydratase
MAFTSPVITLDYHDHIATVWLDRPEARNAMGRALWRDLPRAAADIAGQSDIRVVIIAAKGPHFSVGLDLKEMGGGLVGGGASEKSRAQSNGELFNNVRAMQQAITCFEELPMPVIAATHGYVIGGAIDLITACDIRLAAGDATFSVREAKVGIVADLGTLQRLPRIIGPGHTAELAYTGKDIDAGRADKIGLVNDVIEGSADEVYAAALALAHEIVANSPLVVRGTKSVLAYNDGHSVREGLDFVARWNTMYLSSNDLIEALTAFMEKRPPRYQGN